MTANNYYFLKLHYDILDDWKVGTLPDSLKWRFIQCLCVAGECQDNGLLPDINQFAFRIRQEPTALNSDMARLAANQLVELVVMEDGTERWFISNYEKRQAKIEAKDRMQSYRKRQRKAELDTPELPPRYDSVTTRNTEKNKNRIEKNKNKSAPAPVVIPDCLNTPAFTAAWNDFTEHRKEIKSPMTPRAAAMQLKTLAAYVPDVAVAMIEQTITNGWKGVFELKQNGSKPTGQRKPQHETQHFAGRM